MQWRFLTDKMSRTDSPSVPIALKLVSRFGGDDEVGFRASVRFTSRMRHRTNGFAMSPVVASWGHFVFGEIDRRVNESNELNDEFWNGLWLGVDLVEGDPRLLLRNRVLQHQNSVKQTGKLSPIDLRAITIKAWNSFIEGRTLKFLRWTQVGSAREGFPAITNQEILEDWFRIRL